MDTIEAESLVQTMLNVNEMETGKPKQQLTRNQMVKALAEILPSEGHESEHFKELTSLTSLMLKFVKGYHTDTKAAIEEVHSAAMGYRRAVEDQKRKLENRLDELTQTMIRAEELIERFESIHSNQPIKGTTSLNPERFVCRVCGTAMGRVDLDGTGKWDYRPRYCPGCGALASYGKDDCKEKPKII